MPGRLGSWRMGRDYPNDSIAKNGQNTETSPGDLRRLAVTQTPVRNHQLTLMWKTLKEYIIIIIIIIIMLLLFTPLEFFTFVLADGFHWSFSESKSPQVSRTLLSILAVLNNVVVWMVSNRPPTSKSSSPFSNCFKRTNYNWYNCYLHVP